MKAMQVWAVTAAAILCLGSAVATAAPCSTSAGMKDASKKTKPSSFAPHPRAAHNAYGAPVGGKILTRRVKKQPALHSTPLPPAS